MDIFSACKNGHLWWLERQHQAKIPLEYTLDHNRPLQIASENGHLDIVRWLIRCSGECVSLTDRSCSAIRLAARENHSEIVKYLICEAPIDHMKAATEFRFDFSFPNVFISIVDSMEYQSRNLGYSLLLETARNGNCDLANWLVNDAIHVQKQMFEAYNVELLPEKFELIPVHASELYCTAVSYGHTDYAKWIAPYIGVVDSLNLLMTAIRNGELKTVKWLILEAYQLGLQNVRANPEFCMPTFPDITKSIETNALRMAIQRNHLEVVKYLLLDSYSDILAIARHAGMSYEIPSVYQMSKSTLMSINLATESARYLLEPEMKNFVRAIQICLEKSIPFESILENREIISLLEQQTDDELLQFLRIDDLIDLTKVSKMKHNRLKL